MMNKYIILLLVTFYVSCNGQITPTESDELINAKWYYYSYAIDLKAYDKRGIELQPLACDIKLLRKTKVDKDTTNFFFEASSKDSLNTCSFKPLDLLGITVVRNKLYLPIYHIIVFDIEKDSIILDKMGKQSSLLLNKILEKKEDINPWLKTEVQRRKSF